MPQQPCTAARTDCVDWLDELAARAASDDARTRAVAGRSWAGAGVSAGQWPWRLRARHGLVSVERVGAGRRARCCGVVGGVGSSDACCCWRRAGARGTTSAGTDRTAMGGWARRCFKRLRTRWSRPACATRAVRCCPARPPTHRTFLPPDPTPSSADKYVNLDDGWAIGRHPNGTLIYDPELFPHGIKPVADYVHSKDMLFGICAQA